MPIYTDDPLLSFAENKRRAIAAHEADGPMVAVPMNADDPSGGTAYWLFPTGATLGKGPLEMVQEPPEVLPGAHGWRQQEAEAELHRRHLLYWKLRWMNARRAFADYKLFATGSIGPNGGRVRPGGPTPDDATKLEQLAAEISFCMEKAEAAKAEVVGDGPCYHPASAGPDLVTLARIEAASVVAARKG